jgi:intein/homing endonuclease
MKPIEEIMVGDLVLTHKGRFRPVTKLIQKNYCGELYSIRRRKDFNSITLTEEHPLLTATFHKRSDSKGGRIYSNDNLQVKWSVPPELMAQRSYLISPKMPFGNLTSIKFSDYLDLPVNDDGKIGPKKQCKRYKRIDNNVAITEELMYMLGLFAAEGCATAKRGKQKAHYGTISFAMHLREMPKAQRVVKFFGCGKITQTSKNGIMVTLHHSIWARFLANQIGTGIAKRIPPFVWECSKEMQHAFILGMFEGDGCTKTSNDHNNAHIRYRLKNYTSISPSLAYGIAQLLANRGIYPSINYTFDRKAYVIDWSEDSKCPQHRDLVEGFATRITSIDSEHYNGAVYNFEVEEDESYVTDRTVVHNCITAMEAQAAGLRIVTSSIAALNETVADRGILIDGDWTTQEYKTRFINSVVDAMNKNDGSDRKALQQYAKEHFDLNVLAQDWTDMFNSLLDLLKEHPVIPYQPTPNYR